MTPLHIELLGGMTLTLGGQPLSGLKTRKAEALLAYLACQQRPFTREALAAIFWDGSIEAQALANLRKLLSELRQVVGDYLRIERDVVCFNQDAPHEIDVVTFRQLSAALEERDPLTPDTDPFVARLATAVALYRGDFLAGFYLRDSLAFDEWASLERERLRLRMMYALHWLTSQAVYQGHSDRALSYLQQWLALEPLSEEGHRLLMRLYARRGQRNLALAQYQACASLLQDELNLPPASETRRLAERIRHAPARPYHFPPTLPPLLDRAHELAALNQQLDAPYGRCLTVTGLPGTGKSLLALHAIAHRSSDFRHGIYRVALDGTPRDTAVNGRLWLVQTVIAALNPDLRHESELLDFLRQREMLLLLENVELDAAAVTAFLTRARQVAPHICWLNTGWQPLRLPGEWLLPLQGVAPVSGNEKETTIFTWLYQQATAAYPDLQPATVHNALGAIYQFCDGLPLLLALTAAALRAFPLDEIARQLPHNPDMLTSRARDLPARHRSLTALFQYTWDLLPANEQAALRALAQHEQPIPPTLRTALTAKQLIRSQDAQLPDWLKFCILAANG